MNLMDLFVKISVDDQATKKISTISEKLGNGLKVASKIGVSAIVSLGTAALKTYADFEQLTGGAKLMFGEAFDTVMENAKNAYKTVQMSQNEYLTQVNGFATGLKTALGGNEQAAADLANKIVQAEADIVAATGNTAENVQNAFNGIMRSNFTMLDNLQIGITPTKEGFQEVIDKVNEWNKADGEATDYQMGNLADMQSALVDYIDMVGMSGYAQQEASGTILGSFSSMKSAASDFATSLIDENADVGESWDKLKETVGTFVDNIKPKLEEFLESISPIATAVAGVTSAFVAFKAAASISALLSKLIKSFQAYKMANEGATVAQWLMNAAMNANPIVLIVTLIAGLVAAIITLWNTNEDFRESIIKAWDKIKKFISNAVSEISNFFTVTIPRAGEKLVSWFKAIPERFKEIGKNIVQGVWEGIKSAAAWIRDKVTNFFGGIVDGVKDFLGIHSPSKVFAGIGGFMAEGLGVGFDDEFSGIKKNIENSMNFDAGTISGRYEMSAYSSPVAISEQNRVFSLLEKYLPMLANMKIVLDGGTVVGILAPEIDSALGKINAREARAV